MINLAAAHDHQKKFFVKIALKWTPPDSFRVQLVALLEDARELLNDDELKARRKEQFSNTKKNAREASEQIAKGVPTRTKILGAGTVVELIAVNEEGPPTPEGGISATRETLLNRRGKKLVDEKTIDALRLQAEKWGKDAVDIKCPHCEHDSVIII